MMGKRMPHKFNPHNMKKLEERKKILPPGKVLMELALSRGDVMVDVGAGSGYFSIPASEIVGEKGRVIAVDNSKEMIQELKSRTKALGIENIEIIVSNEYDLLVDDDTA
jgi:precorrin-6B methylase 2